MTLFVRSRRLSMFHQRTTPPGTLPGAREAR
jgi:hypothetical protein